MALKKYKSLAPAVLLFALYIFAFLLTEFTVNVRAAAVLGTRA